MRALCIFACVGVEGTVSKQVYGSQLHEIKLIVDAHFHSMLNLMIKAASNDFCGGHAICHFINAFYN